MHYKLLLKDELEAEQRQKMQKQQKAEMSDNKANISMEDEFKLDYDKQPENVNNFDQ
jgi:hypothetical protein